MSNGDSTEAATSGRPPTVKASLADVETWCEAAELPLPPGPGSGKDLLRIGDNLFATWQPQVSAYDFDAFMAEAWAKAADGDWLFGVDGHGTQSWAVHWMRRRGQLLLGIQVRVGGAFAPGAVERDAVVGAWGLAKRFDAALARAAKAQHLPAGKVLVVLDTDLAEGRYAWLTPGDDWETAGWNEDAMAGFSALMELEDLAEPEGARQEARA